MSTSSSGRVENRRCGVTNFWNDGTWGSLGKRLPAVRSGSSCFPESRVGDFLSASFWRTLLRYGEPGCPKDQTRGSAQGLVSPSVELPTRLDACTLRRPLIGAALALPQVQSARGWKEDVGCDCSGDSDTFGCDYARHWVLLSTPTHWQHHHNSRISRESRIDWDCES